MPSLLQIELPNILSSCLSDHFNPIGTLDVDKTLGSKRTTTCALILKDITLYIAQCLWIGSVLSPDFSGQEDNGLHVPQLELVN